MNRREALQQEIKLAEARREQIEIEMREEENERKWIEWIQPLMTKAGEFLGLDVTAAETIKWHAVRGDERCKAALAQMNDPEAMKHEEEVEAAFTWHPAWHECADGSWECDTPDNPEVWETDKLLAQYRQHLANQQNGT